MTKTEMWFDAAMQTIFKHTGYSYDISEVEL